MTVGEACTDERLSKEKLTALLMARPADFKYVNAAIWYGTPPAYDLDKGVYHTLCGEGKLKGLCCTHAPDDKACDVSTQCCAGWTVQDISAIKPPPPDPKKNCLVDQPCEEATCKCTTDQQCEDITACAAIPTGTWCQPNGRCHGAKIPPG